MSRKKNELPLNKVNRDIDTIPIDETIITEELAVSKQQSAKQAIKILIDQNQGFHEPTALERTNLLVAFAKKNKVIYGKAFDIIRFKHGRYVNLSSVDDIEKNLSSIVICEIKSTSKKEVKINFDKYFFGLSTAELLVAQSLREYFRFIFVNVKTKEVMELSLKQVFEKARGIYPVWSIQF